MKLRDILLSIGLLIAIPILLYMLFSIVYLAWTGTLLTAIFAAIVVMVWMHILL